jgi:site-specific DNA-methyltransferase (adenine-specific)
MEKDIDLWLGDSQELLSCINDNQIDSIVTDPPYGLSFMGKDWDKALPPIEIWRECARVLKPGGYLIAMSASRTYHRLAVQLEDLGLICHPMIGWIYGSGFPKATDLSKQFDKAAGAKREVVGKSNRHNSRSFGESHGDNYGDYSGGIPDVTAPSTDQAKKWNGWKYGLQALKPALEPIAVFQKPHLKPMIKNIEKWGCGAMNIDGCRVKAGERPLLIKDIKTTVHNTYGDGLNGSKAIGSTSQGRHPANLVHSGEKCVEEEFLRQRGITETHSMGHKKAQSTGMFGVGEVTKNWTKSEKGSASRFFNSLPITQEDFIPFKYVAKASKRERGENNRHATVKPIALMEWLIKLVTPPEGICIDPFMGSGTTGIAAKRNGFRFIGIEREEEFYKIAKMRIDYDGGAAES